MWVNGLTLFGLMVTAFSLATCLEPWFQSWSGSRTQSTDLITVALGDSRRLFARHAYVKADVYFHGGYYPTIYEDATSGMHITAHARTGGKEEDDCSPLGKPKDWLERFGRNFYPSTHRHLGDTRVAHLDGEEREILPWLRLSAILDPQQVETYVVGAYWMRTQLGRVNEAEQFLREGLRGNPGQPELLFELGRIYLLDRHDVERARNLWELALRNWQKLGGPKDEERIFLGAQILGNLGKLEETQGNYNRAIEHLTALHGISPNKAALQKWIEELKQKAESIK